MHIKSLVLFSVAATAAAAGSSRKSALPGGGAASALGRKPSTRGKRSLATVLPATKSATSSTSVPVAVVAEREVIESSSLLSTLRGGVAAELPDAMKLCIGAGGIYAAFMYYGLLQEGVFSYEAADGSRFKQVWFLMVLESLANVLVGFLGRQVSGPTAGLPMKMFAVSGATQVFAKAFTNLALRFGVSFPVVTLAKSGKMVPVMLGSIILGGASYSLREYLQVGMVIGGTVMVSMAKKAKKAGASSSNLGVGMVLLSLACDGATGGMQKRIKVEQAAKGVKAKPYDFMFFTNWFMMWTALFVAAAQGELGAGYSFCAANPVILQKIARFAVCSAIGQSFIFYTIANFEPLVCSTVTTTRKIFSVLLSIFVNNHKLNAQGWGGIGVACLGILGELEDKYSKQQKAKQ